MTSASPFTLHLFNLDPIVDDRVGTWHRHQVTCVGETGIIHIGLHNGCKVGRGRRKEEVKRYIIVGL